MAKIDNRSLPTLYVDDIESALVTDVFASINADAIAHISNIVTGTSTNLRTLGITCVQDGIVNVLAAWFSGTAGQSLNNVKLRLYVDLSLIDEQSVFNLGTMRMIKLIGAKAVVKGAYNIYVKLKNDSGSTITLFEYAGVVAGSCLKQI